MKSTKKNSKKHQLLSPKNNKENQSLKKTKSKRVSLESNNAKE